MRKKDLHVNSAYANTYLASHCTELIDLDVHCAHRNSGKVGVCTHRTRAIRAWDVTHTLYSTLLILSLHKIFSMQTYDYTILFYKIQTLVIKMMKHAAQ